MHVVRSLKEKGCKVVGVENLNDYYDVNLKITRLHNLGLASFEEDHHKTEMESLTF